IARRWSGKAPPGKARCRKSQAGCRVEGSPALREITSGELLGSSLRARSDRSHRPKQAARHRSPASRGACSKVEAQASAGLTRAKASDPPVDLDTNPLNRPLGLDAPSLLARNDALIPARTGAANNAILEYWIENCCNSFSSDRREFAVKKILI